MNYYDYIKENVKSLFQNTTCPVFEVYNEKVDKPYAILQFLTENPLETPVEGPPGNMKYAEIPLVLNIYTNVGQDVSLNPELEYDFNEYISIFDKAAKTSSPIAPLNDSDAFCLIQKIDIEGYEPNINTDNNFGIAVLNGTITYNMYYK